MLGGEYFLADAINIMLEAGLDMRVEEVDVWVDCGKPDALLETNRYLLEHGRDNSAHAAQREGVLVVPPVYVDPSAEVRRSVLGPHVSVGPGCKIEDSIIRDSILEEGARVEGSALSASLVGRHALVQGGFRALNVGDNSEVGPA